MKQMTKWILISGMTLLPMISMAADNNPRLRYVCGKNCVIRGGSCAPGEMVTGSGESQSYIDNLVASCKRAFPQQNSGDGKVGTVFYVCYSGKEGFQGQDGRIYGRYVNCHKSTSSCNPVFRTAVGESAADRVVQQCQGTILPPKN